MVVVDKLELPVDEFIPQVPEWRALYLGNNPCVWKVEAIIQRKYGDTCLQETLCLPQLPKVEYLIGQRVENLRGTPRRGYLEMADIEIVVHWGSKFMGSRLLSRIYRNDPAAIERHTADAIDALKKNDPAEALKHINCIFGLSDAFGSKVLAFLEPETCPIWDRIARDCLSRFGSRREGIKNYIDFIDLCKYIADGLDARKDENPRGAGRWC